VSAVPVGVGPAGRFLGRLGRERLALASLAVLVLIALACLFGPQLTGHEADRAYPDLRQLPSGAATQPDPAHLGPALERLAFRMRVRLDAVARDGETLRLTLGSDAGVDRRSLVYLPRSGLFGSPTVVEDREAGRSLVVAVPIRRLRFLLGTDVQGRDLLTRCLVAGRISLAIGLAASLVALLIGVVYGATAGVLGGAADAVMMRGVDVLYALPFVFFVILLLVFFRPSLMLMLVAIAAVEWLDMARVVRAQTLSLRERDFVRAARALGVGTPGIILRHIVPNTLGPVAVTATLLVPQVILLESFLSFLGLGVQEPQTSWGVLIADGARSIESAPHMLAGPAAFLIATLVALNLLGDGLADALDPRGA
jgi:oligopeptide transport system permease protein